MLEVRNLGLVYPNGYEALKSISLAVRDGELIGIVGRSGAGKSTLLRCINGLERPTSGAVLLDGAEVSGLPAGELRCLQGRIGFIWQEFNLVERLTVLNNVLTGRLAHAPALSSTLFHFDRTHRAKAIESLARVNMLHRASQRADRLSGGEKQRVAIARAIAQEPRVLLADEPVASLDPELADQVLADLASIARAEGVPTLINIHAVDLARQYCDRIVGIAGGVIVFDGPPGELDAEALDRIYRFDRPRNPIEEQVRELVGAAP